MSEPSFPYFDDLIDKIKRGDGETELLWGTNVHFGYWDDPCKAVYDRSDFVAAARRMNEILIERAAIRNGLSILDVGCGFGGTIKQLDGNFEGLKLVGLNVDERQLDRARSEVLREPRNEVSLVKGDGCEMPFEAASFDVILAIECVFHFESRFQFLLEAKRVLKPGGVLVISDFLGLDTNVFSLNSWISKKELFQNWGRVSFTSQEGYRNLIQKAGIDELKIEDITNNILPNCEILFRHGIENYKREREHVFRFLISTGLIRYVSISARVS